MLYYNSLAKSVRRGRSHAAACRSSGVGLGPGRRGGAGRRANRATAAAHRSVARHHRHGDAARRGAQLDPAQPRRHGLRLQQARHRERPAGRERAAQPGAAARARRGAGQFRPDPRARRPRQRAVPARRRAVAGRPVAVQQHPGHALRRPDVAAHRRLACPVRPADRRHRRHHREVGHDRSRRRGLRSPAARATIRSPPSPMAAAPARSTISRPASTSTTVSASRIRPRRSRRSTTTPTNGTGWPRSPASSTRTRGSSFIAGGASSRFQIPNVPFQTPNFTVNGQTDLNSSILDQRQWEKSYFAIASLQKSYQDVNFQLSGFARYSSLSYQPDPFGDLVFNGIAPWTKRTSFATGVQGDGSWKVARQAHAARRLPGAARARHQLHPGQYPAAGAAIPTIRTATRSRPTSPRFHRRLRSHRLDLQRLPAGRMADRAHRHGEFRPAFRRHQRRHPGEPAQPAHQRRVAAQRDVHRPRRLFPLLHAAAAPPGQRQLDRDAGRHGRRARSDDERSR